MPTLSKPETSAIHRVLIDSGVDPKLIHPAIEEMRNLSGQNVTTAIGAQVTELRSDLKTQITELRSEVKTQITELRTEMQAQITELRSEMQAQIDGLRTEMQVQITELRGEMQIQFAAFRAEMNTLNKIIWTLMSLLAIPILGLFYKILAS